MKRRTNDITSKSQDCWSPLEEVISKDLFKSEVRAWAKRIGVEIRDIHVRPMKHKWGSCSTTGRATFDLQLLSQPSAFRKEIIIHELLHLKVANHGKLFRALLKAYMGMAS